MKRLFLNAALLAGGGRVWDAASMSQLLGDTANTHLQKLAKKYNLEYAEPQPMDPSIADKVTSVFESILAPKTAGAFLLSPDDLDDVTNDDGEPLAFELDAATISDIFNRSLQAAVEPLLRYAAISDLDPGPSFAELQQPNATRLNIALNTLGLSLDMVTVSKQREAILAFSESLDVMLAEQQPQNYEAVYSFMELQADVLPLFHDALPHLHLLTQRALAALREVQPSRINPVTIVPAILEMVTAAVSVQTTVERMLPVTSLWLREGANAIQVVAGSDLQGVRLVSVLDAFSNVCDSLGNMDPFYKPAMNSAREVIANINVLAPDFVELIGTYLTNLPILDELGRVVFDLGEDMSGSLKKALESFEREGPLLVDFYENAEDFVPLLVSHVIRVLRQGGIATRTPMIREAVPTVQELVDATRHFTQKHDEHISDLLDSIVELAAQLPRQTVLTRSLADLLLHGAVATNQARATLVPNTVALLEAFGHVLDQLGGNGGLPGVLNAVRQAIEAMVKTLPGVSASVPLLAPIMRSSYEVTTSVLPTLKVLVANEGVSAVQITPALAFLLDVAETLPVVIHGSADEL